MQFKRTVQKEKASKAAVKRLDRSIGKAENIVIKRVLRKPKVKMAF